MKVIGFAGTYFTLWNVDKEPVYFSDVFGKPHLTGYNFRYTYFKNISADIKKVKHLYPGTGIDENLRGITTSWVKKNEDDLCPEILKNGKYAGHNVHDVIKKDFAYVIWLVQNYGYTTSGIYAKALPEVVKHFQDIAQNEEALILANEAAFNKIVSLGSYTFIAEKNLKINEDFAYMTLEIEGFSISLIFKNYSLQNYKGFDYGLPILDGKAKRIKNKSITVSFKKCDSDIYALEVTDFKINK